MSHCARPHVLATGASSGIGHAIALYLGTAGHHVYAGVRKPDDGAALQRDARGEVTPLILDVTNAEQIRAAVDTVSIHVGDAGLTGLVNNAGIRVRRVTAGRPASRICVACRGRSATSQAHSCTSWSCPRRVPS